MLNTILDVTLIKQIAKNLLAIYVLFNLMITFL
jgi:hypothetical protein